MKRFVRTAWALGLAGAMVAPAMAQAQGANKPVVAVLSFDNNSIGKDAADYNGIGKGVADMLITDLAGNPNVVVVDRDRIQQVLQEQNLIKQGAIDPETAVRIGKILGAQYMITGGFMSDGRGNMVLTARSISVQTTAVTNPQRVQAQTDDVLGMIAKMSDKVTHDMKLPPMEHHNTGMTDKSMGNMGNMGSKPEKMDIRTAMLYSKALDAKDNGDPKRAAELFRQVLVKFPDYSPAKTNLEKVSKSGD